EILNVER
ncbi:hypothetical protein KL928_005446, partial [Ogataea angusta]